MKRTLAIAAAAVGLASLIVLGFVVGRMTSHPSRETSTASRRVLYWVDPMHPAYKSDKPGIAPDCGMALEPVYADDTSSSQASLQAGSVSLSSERQQLIGIRTQTASISTGSRTVRTTGRVVADENHLYKINAGADGWIESLDDNPPGAVVKKGQELAKLYSPDFRTAETTYLGFVVSVERLRQSMSQDEMKQVEDSSRFNEEQLRLFGMGDEQLDQLRKTHRQTSVINLQAPADGIVLTRSISPRQRFEKGQELFRIADLSKIWIIADIHGDDGAPRPGTRVKVSVPELGRTLEATVSSSTPLFDETSRTLKLRLEADNPGLLMRPNMYADIEFQAKVSTGISIPAEAVLDSGLRKIVYVEVLEGVFEPRPVEISGAFADRVIVTRGIADGDRIVVSGNFLLDSESRMRSKSSTSPTPLSETKTAMHADHGTEMLMRSEANANHADSAEIVRDPVCGMELKPAEVKFTESYGGKRFHLCSEICRNKFLADPAKYASSAAASKALPRTQAAPSHD